MNKTHKIALELSICHEMGRLAFEEGMKRIPAKDKRIMSVIADSDKMLSTCDALKAWINGWAQANLSEKVI